jgi:hypothetical protein
MEYFTSPDWVSEDPRGCCPQSLFEKRFARFDLIFTQECLDAMCRGEVEVSVCAACARSACNCERQFIDTRQRELNERCPMDCRGNGSGRTARDEARRTARHNHAGPKLLRRRKEGEEGEGCLGGDGVGSLPGEPSVGVEMGWTSSAARSSLQGRMARSDLTVEKICLDVNGCGLYRIVNMHRASQERPRCLKELALTCFKACNCFRACASIRATEGSREAGT